MSHMANIAKGTFDVTIQAEAAELDGAVERFALSKTFHGGIEGTSEGVMLSCGDLKSGNAGYGAIETVRGRVGELHGGFALQQFGSMHEGSQLLYYKVVPGSGSDQLSAIAGTLLLNIDADGTHRYELHYDL
jgi:hypothetical protein